MTFRVLILGVCCAWFSPFGLCDETVFSGPQVGERLPAFTAKGVVEPWEGKDIDFVGVAKDHPLLLIFFHERTRPAFAMTRAIMKFAASKADQGLQSGVVFLTDDPTTTDQWAKSISTYFPKDVRYGVSRDGQEGPGSYGLNRNVTMTILVADKGVVTANFALVQPQLQADGPAILKAIADVTGGGEVPSVEDLLGDEAGGARMRMESGRGQAKPANRPTE